MALIFLFTTGSSANSLDISSSQTMEINTTTTGVIELNQQLTSKRPLRPEATRERRSSAASRSISIDGSGVCSSPSQNSIASTLSTSSDDVPPPLPVKQNVIDGYNPTPPEKPALPTNPIDINEDTSSLPPPPPPKKPVRIIPKWFDNVKVLSTKKKYSHFVLMFFPSRLFYYILLY